jgi:hypothetical protein
MMIIISQPLLNYIDDAMTRVFISNAVARGFKSRLDQIRDYEIGICVSLC